MKTLLSIVFFKFTIVVADAISTHNMRQTHVNGAIHFHGISGRTMCAQCNLISFFIDNCFNVSVRVQLNRSFIDNETEKRRKKTHIKFSTLLAMNVIVPFNGMKYRKVLFYQSPRTIMWFQRTIKSTKILQLSPFAKFSPLFSIRFLWASEWVCVNGIYPSVYDIHVETK